MSDNIEYISSTQQSLEKAGFRVLNPVEKLEYDIGNVKKELNLSKTLVRFFQENPDKLLIHPQLGEVDAKHRLCSTANVQSLESTLIGLEKKLKKIKVQARKEDPKKSFTLIKNEGDNIVSISRTV